MSLAVTAFTALLWALSYAAPPNVLFLVSDDMRPQLGAYIGPDFPTPVFPRPHTPVLDRLASRSLLLMRAFVQQALCSPSRTSVLTGRRPDTTHVYDLDHYFRKVGGNFTTLPQYFKENGYLTVGIGKIFHPGPASGNDDPISWSVPYYHAPNDPYWSTYNISWLPVNKETMNRKPLPDQQLRDRAVSTLKSYSIQRDRFNGTQPLFLAVGFHKPHLPFVFPEEFLNLYPQDDIRLPDNQFAPDGMPDLAWFPFGGLRSYRDIEKLHASGKINTTFPYMVVRSLRRAYYSALSYTDSLIGDILSTLDQVGLANNTIVAFWGDHGYQLGEHGEWCKQTNFELATHAPMMIRIPGRTDGGIVTNQLTEFVDLFPTLVDAAGLPSLPRCPENSSAISLCSEGTSLLPLVGNPLTVRWKERVFSQFPRNKYMGYTMRTHRYRYTEWVEFIGRPMYRPVWNNCHGVELYDHQIDSEENRNRANDSEYVLIRAELSQQLHHGWRYA